MRQLVTRFAQIFVLIFIVLLFFMYTRNSLLQAKEEEARNSGHVNIDDSIKDNIVLLDLEFGQVLIELYPQYAPKHVQRIKDLTSEGFYDGLAFHRVIENFMAQTGDPQSSGAGKSSKPDLIAEFNEVKHKRGIVSMARAMDLNSANSQFFIMLADAPHLDNQYTAFGKVISGMEYVDKIKKGNPNNNGLVENPTRIIHMTLLKNRK